MEPTLTEFSYGYCVTEEFANAMGLNAAPYFPNLYAEGKTGGGFDVQIGSALFLQFKLSEQLTRRSAKECRRNLLDPPFFRFKLHRRNKSKQHQMLIDLEGQTGAQVYYIAPAFSEIDALNLAYTTHSVVQRSGMFSPTEIGQLPDDETHSLAFSLDQDVAWFLSEPRRITINRGAQLRERALSRPGPLESDGSEEWLYRIASQMKAIIFENFESVAESLALLDREGRQYSALDQVGYLARAYFACEVLFAPPQR